MSSNRMNTRSRKRTNENTSNESASNYDNDDQLPDINSQVCSFATSKRTKQVNNLSLTFLILNLTSYS